MADERKYEPKATTDRETEKPDNRDTGKELIKTGGPIFDTPEGEDAKKKSKDEEAA